MSEYLKIARGWFIMVIGYFAILYVVDKFFLKVIDSTSVLVGVLLPSVIVGLALGEKLRKKV